MSTSTSFNVLDGGQALPPPSSSGGLSSKLNGGHSFFASNGFHAPSTPTSAFEHHTFSMPLTGSLDFPLDSGQHRPSLGGTTHHPHHPHTNHLPSPSPSLNHTREYLFMNRKLSGLSLDSNGNDAADPLGNYAIPNGLLDSFVNNEFAFSPPNNAQQPQPQPHAGQLGAQQQQPGQHYQPNPPFGTGPHSPAAHLWNFDFVLRSLRNRLSALKTVQAEFEDNFLASQSQYAIFAHQVRFQVNALLQEMNDDLELMFKGRMGELSAQQCHIEELLFRIEAKAKAKANGGGGGSGLNGAAPPTEETQSFVNYFDGDFVKFVRATIEGTIPCADIRQLNFDQATIERTLRGFIMGLLKPGGGGGGQQNGGGPSTGQGPGTDGTATTTSNGAGGNYGQAVLPPASAWNNDCGPNSSKVPMPTYSSIVEQSANRSNNGNGNAPNGRQTQGQDPYSLEGEPNNCHASSTSFYPNSQSSASVGSLSQQLSNSGTGGGSSAALQEANRQAMGKSLQPKIRRDRMSYVLKFGEQGAQVGQFAEPSGVAVNPTTEDIYIADANNHRIQVFDKWGKFKFHFGEGKLKFPNRVAISGLSGEIVVSERPPVHQIQVYDKTGAFLCKFGSKHLRHPRGLCIDHKNRIVVVECKVMRVFIFNLRGDLLHSFDCSSVIQFPNAVAVSRAEEIYISDNRSHCVKVFSFSGEALRTIGGAGVTNYPIGVILNESAGQLLVVDNYNNLNVTIFRTDGQLLAAYESSIKHQQCLDVAPFTENTLVVTSKDLQVYIYRIKELGDGGGSFGFNRKSNGNFELGDGGGGGFSYNRHTNGASNGTNSVRRSYPSNGSSVSQQNAQNAQNQQNQPSFGSQGSSSSSHFNLNNITNSTFGNSKMSSNHF